MKDHKRMYKIYLRASMVASLVVFMLLFTLVPYTEPEPFVLKHDIVTMVEQIAIEMEKIVEPPPVERPRVAVSAKEGEDKNLVTTIPRTDFNDFTKRIIPTDPDIEIIPFYKLEVKPKPICIPQPEYPEILRKAGIEGNVVVQVLVDIDGGVCNVKILKSSGNKALDKAALAAAMEAQFTPAKQRDRHVRVWVSIPFGFKLRG